MKAIVQTKYGSPDLLELKEIVKPVPKDDEVLIKVYASSVNFANTAMMSGKPFLIRLMLGGLFNPKYIIPGNDAAGRVEAAGKNVKQFKPGDDVYGDLAVYSGPGFGAYAEYVCVRENLIGLKPSNVTYEEAAAAAQAGIVALQGLRAGKIQQGKKVLIYGASGGIGTFAVQIAKSFGAEVTGVCGSKNLDMLRSIGADHVIDYTKEDFTKNDKHYDLILAVRGYHSIFDYKRSLNPNGIYVMVGGSWSQIFQPVLLGPFVFITGNKQLGNFTHKPNQQDFAFMKELIETGKVKPVIDRCYTLSNLADALRYYEVGHAKGKVVITIANDI